ncbi:MAG: hypothetical protein U1A78_41605 [Polyangia bacterium]
MDKDSGHVVTEDDISDEVARNRGFWEYVDSLVSGGKLPEQGGVWEFRVRLTFYNVDGAPAVLDQSTGDTSATSAEAYSFHRSSKGTTDRDNAVDALLRIGTELVRSHQLLQQEFPKMLSATATEAAKLMQAGAGPLASAIDRITELSKAETERANKSMEAVARLLKQKAEEAGDDWPETLLKLAPLVPVVDNWLSNRRKGPPN